MTVTVTRVLVDGLGFDLVAEVAAFAKAVEDHRHTVDVPAPVAHPLVEMIVREHGGRFDIDETPEPVATPAPLLDAAGAPMDPVAKLASFLQANPDVKALLT